MLQAKDRHAPRVVVDVEHHRSMRQDGFLREIRALGRAGEGDRTAHAVGTDELSYDRRIVHTAFKDDPSHRTTSSPADDTRLKRIVLSLRR